MKVKITDRTTKQMLAAPVDGIYVWPNQNKGYAKGLARSLDRPDLRILSVYEISRNSSALRGERVPITLDHAVINADDIKTIGRNSMSRLFNNRFKPDGMRQINSNMFIETGVNGSNDAHIMCPWDKDIYFNMEQLTALRDEINKLLMQQLLLGETVG